MPVQIKPVQIWAALCCHSLPVYWSDSNACKEYSGHMQWLILGVSLTRTRRFPNIWLNIISECVCESVSRLVSIWPGGLSKEDCHPPVLVVIIQFIEGGFRIEQKAEGEWNYSCVLPHCWTATSHLIFSFPQTGVYTIGSPGSQVFRLRLNYTNVFPGSPACTW